MNELHASSSSARGRLYYDGKAYLLRYCRGVLFLVYRAAAPRKHRHAGARSDLLGLNLIAHETHDRGGRADELDSAIFANLGERGVLG